MVLASSYGNLTGAGTISNAGEFLRPANDGPSSVTPSFLNTGTINVPGGTLSLSALTVNDQGILQGEPGGTLTVSGNFSGTTRGAAHFSPLATVVLNGVSNRTSPQLLEVMSADLRNVAAGFKSNFVYDSLSQTASYVQLGFATVSLLDAQGAVVATTSNSQSGADATLPGIALLLKFDSTTLQSRPGCWRASRHRPR